MQNLFCLWKKYRAVDVHTISSKLQLPDNTNKTPYSTKKFSFLNCHLKKFSNMISVSYNFTKPFFNNYFVILRVLCVYNRCFCCTGQRRPHMGGSGTGNSNSNSYPYQLIFNFTNIFKNKNRTFSEECACFVVNFDVCKRNRAPASGMNRSQKTGDSAAIRELKARHTELVILNVMDT